MAARAATVGLLMRHTVNLGVAVVALGDPHSPAQPAGAALLALLAVWSLYRLSTRSRAARWLALDYLLVLLVCLSIPMLVSGTDFHLSNSAPQAIAGTAVVSLSVAVSPRVSLLLVTGIASAYAGGVAQAAGWSEVASVNAMYYFAVQWATASVIRAMLLGLAATVDRARADRHQAELARQVDAAVRDYEHEQLALLHDTAASTLLMVGHGTAISPTRIAAQARRDLALLGDTNWRTPPRWVDLVAALRQCAEHVATPVEFDGPERLWLPGRTAHPVVAAVREIMTNTDRHARATLLRVSVSDTAVRLHDDGVGFDGAAARDRHGLRDSVLGRMQRAGGRARITSTPGQGTSVELWWRTDHPRPAPPADTDPLTLPARMRYGLALTVYAVVNLLITVPAAAGATHTGLNAALGVLAGLGALAAVPRILWGRSVFVWPAAVALLVVAVVQPLSVTHGSVIGYAHWAQAAIGWCVLPLLLGLRTRTGVTILVGYWVVGNSVVLWLDPSAAAWVNIGLGSASILAVQLFALIFSGLMRDAAADAQTETTAHHALLAQERVAAALRAEYRRRYADIVDSVVPLLDALSRGRVDRDTQLRARAECRRLRALFDQASTFDHPLMQRIRPLVDAAEARQVDVVVDLTGPPPDLTDTTIDALIEPLRAVLGRAKSSARLVITSTPEWVEVSVVCDLGADDTLDGHPPGVEVVVAGDQMWCLVRRPVTTAGSAR
ncbi:ATP-binding protein [Mycolicibacterium duvalii]|nr:ATP-binding protein [Mycolicibacterium duvalii]PEG39066.1 ATP-binding protein [Mycolicibacterium duvalii]